MAKSDGWHPQKITFEVRLRGSSLQRLGLEHGFSRVTFSVVPWCAIFINAMLDAAGLDGSGSAMARSFVKHPKFKRLEEPVVGCITVISSSRGPTSGHVFFYAGENGLFLQGVGGNQDDQVSIAAAFHKAKLVGHFWPKGVPVTPAPFNRPVRLAMPTRNKAVRDA